MTQYSAEAGRNFNFFTALHAAISALGRFVGPLIFSAAIFIEQSDPSACNPLFNYYRAYDEGSTYIDGALAADGLCTTDSVCLLMFPLEFYTNVRHCAHSCLIPLFLAGALSC
eukprot:m.89952 g.89952  ORF g.89952 m.89952 type:complete len:113 (+) comp8437_c0_seq2:1181-1519(+)